MLLHFTKLALLIKTLIVNLLETALLVKLHLLIKPLPFLNFQGFSFALIVKERRKFFVEIIVMKFDQCPNFGCKICLKHPYLWSCICWWSHCRCCCVWRKICCQVVIIMQTTESHFRTETWCSNFWWFGHRWCSIDIVWARFFC